MHFVRDLKYLSEYNLLLTFKDGSLRQVDLAIRVSSWIIPVPSKTTRSTKDHEPTRTGTREL